MDGQGRQLEMDKMSRTLEVDHVGCIPKAFQALLHLAATDPWRKLRGVIYPLYLHGCIMNVCKDFLPPGLSSCLEPRKVLLNLFNPRKRPGSGHNRQDGWYPGRFQAGISSTGSCGVQDFRRRRYKSALETLKRIRGKDEDVRWERETERTESMLLWQNATTFRIELVECYREYRRERKLGGNQWCWL